MKEIFPSIRFGVSAAFVLSLTLLLGWSVYHGKAAPGLDHAGLPALYQTHLTVLLILLSAYAASVLSLRFNSIQLRRSVEALAWLLFIAFFLWIDRRPLLSGLNTSGDHLMQYLLARLTETGLWEHGQFHAWCNAIGPGFPLNDLYPPGGHFLYLALRTLSLGFLPPPFAYAWSVLVSYLLYAFLLWSVVRRVFGTLAGCFLLWFLLLDGTDSLQFGWPMFFQVGMWGGGLGMALSIFAFYLSAEQDSSSTQSGILALYIAASILLHPLFLFVNTLWISILIGVRFWREEQLNLKWIIWIGLGFGLSAFWWLPFALSREWVHPFGDWGRLRPDIEFGVWSGSLFTDTSALVSVLCVLSVIASLFSPRRFTFSLGLFSGLTFFIATESARETFSFSAAQNFFDHLQSERMIGVSKIAAFLLLAGFAAEVFSMAATRLDCGPRWHRIRAWIVTNGSLTFSVVLRDLFRLTMLLAILLPGVVLIQAAAHGFWRWSIQPFAHRMSSQADNVDYWRNFHDALQVVEQRTNVPQPADFFRSPWLHARVLTLDPWREVSTPFHSDLGVYVPGYMPAMLLITRPWTMENDLLDLTSTEYAVHYKKSNHPPLQPPENWTSVYENREFTVFQRANSHLQGWKLYGPGEVALIQEQPNRITFSAKGTHQDSYLRLGISRYRKWKILLNGKPLDRFWHTRPYEAAEAGKLLGLPLQDGTIELRYQEEWFDRIAWAITVISVLFIAVVSLGRLPLDTGLAPLSRFIHPRRWRYIYPLLPIAALLYAGSLFLAKSSPIHPQIEYLGLKADYVGQTRHQPDGQIDLCFEVSFPHESEYGHVFGMELLQLDEQGLPIPGRRWHTGSQTDLDYLYMTAVDFLGKRRNNPNGTLDLPPGPDQHLWIYAAPPPTESAPASIRIQMNIYYENGSVQTIEQK